MTMDVASYDWSPIVRMMLMGVVLALGPLAWVALRNRGASPARRRRALTLLTLFLTFDLVLFGAFTRLTDSGLGCPDWPGCYGKASPIGAHAEISAAQTAMPTGPVTHTKAWIEMVHRYLATAVGVLILALAAVSWAAWRQRPRDPHAIHPGWPTLTLFWVCLQGAFGAWTVTFKLFPAIVVLHLLGGLALLALLCAQVVRDARRTGALQPVVLPPGLRGLLWGTAALVLLQIALGGWVSTNYAVLACSDFPTCQGNWWPAMDFAQAFQVWRPLGRLADGSHIAFPALTAIHYVHRLAAYAVLAALAGLAWRLWHVPGLQRPVRWLAALAAWQFGTGLSNVVLDWPLVAAVSHTGGAAGLVVVLTWLLCATESVRTAVPASLQRTLEAAR
jgi:cytochrome c oxidase assembly protein subunit 15